MSLAPLNDLRLQLEWESSEGIRTPEHAATWSRLQLWADEECITRVEDVENESTRRSIYASMYPLAEWVAYNWWALQADVRPSALRTGAFAHVDSPHLRAWMRTHNTITAGDGFVWPNLAILPEGPATRLVWHADRRTRPGAPIRYVSSGEASVESTHVERVLADLVETVISRLDEVGIRDTPLHAEWEGVTALTEEEVEYCLAAARLGLDPYSVDDWISEHLIEAASSLEDRLLREFLEAVEPVSLGTGLGWVLRATSDIEKADTSSSKKLKSLRDQTLGWDNALAHPWSRGWAEASALRQSLDAGHLDAFDMAGIFESSTRTSPDPHLQGLGRVDEDDAGTLILGRRMKKRDERFAHARALWHALGPRQTGRFLLTSSPAYGSRVERAFAAEFLAPAEGVRELLGAAGSDLVTTPQIDQAAKHFGVNPHVIRHQAENQLALAVAS